MTRDDLEAVIWDQLRLARGASSWVPVVNAILLAAEAYAAGNSEDVTSRRRQVLARDGWRTP